MATSILGVGKSALMAAQAGLATTGHNIANASTPGYNRQVVVQGAIAGQDVGYGFLGKGTEVVAIKRVYDEFLSNQVTAAQTTKSHLDAYYGQITRLNNQFADEASGISSVMQDFFKSLQGISSNLSQGPARMAAMTSAETLAARFQSLDGQLNAARAGVASQLESSVGNINTYANQIAKLNDAIEKAYVSGDGRAPNDLLDQRDLAIAELSKEIKATVVKQGHMVNITIGNGQPIVSGSKSFGLTTTGSLADPSRMVVGYTGNGLKTEIPEDTLTGGRLGGLLEFRAKTLDATQNALGRIAVGMAVTFNAQHRLGQDQSGAMGGDFFRVGTPEVIGHAKNSAGAGLNASITDAGALTGSDYRLQKLNGNYVLTRLSDRQQWDLGATLPIVHEGLTITGPDNDPTNPDPLADGDEFLIKPTVKGAGQFSVLINDPAKIAAAAPIRTAADAANIGSGKISAGVVNESPVDPDLQREVRIVFKSASVYDVIDVATNSPLGSDLPFPPPNDEISYNGWTVKITGSPAAGDTFTIEKNENAASDNRNILLLAELQTKNTLGGEKLTYQGAYAQLVNTIGNKAHELEVTSAAEGKLLAHAIESQQMESGVNLDEEAANLMRYQQAYQAASKVMQTANELFELLLTIGN